MFVRLSNSLPRSEHPASAQSSAGAVRADVTRRSGEL